MISAPILSTCVYEELLNKSTTDEESSDKKSKEPKCRVSAKWQPMYILPSLQFTAHYPSITWGLNRSSSFLQSDCHQSVLMKLLTEEIGCEKQNILDFDLHLADNQPAVSTVLLSILSHRPGEGAYFFVIIFSDALSLYFHRP